MPWPLSQDYNEAIQSPATSLADPELRSGQPTTNALGMPQPRSGNFADVYEFECPQGRWAVKCFTREVPGLRERYAEISRYLASADLSFAVEFHYLEQGVRIRGAWYPALKMRWVEGQLLNEFVRDNLGKPARLQALSQIWSRMAKRLREANLAHADLQHGNVILVPGSAANSLAVKLIDYDGMFVPALAGRGSAEVGHANYQHPQRLREGTYGPEVDRFPLLVVATALRALTVGGQELWDRYDNGDNLMFKESDLRDPAKSALFAELLRSADPETVALTKQLASAVALPLEQCPLLDEPEPVKVAVSALRPRAAQVVPRAPEPVRKAKSKRDTGRKAAPSRVPLIAGVAVAVLALVLGVVWAMRPPKEKEVAKLPDNTVEKQGGKKGPDKTPVKTPDKTPPANPPVVAALPAKVGELRRFEGGPTVAFSPDGRLAAYANTSHNIALWDLVKNAEVGQLAGHDKDVCVIRFSPDGKKLLSGSDDETLRVWDIKTAQPVKQFPFPGGESGVKAAAWNPDGRTIVSLDGHREVVVRNAVTGEEVQRTRTGVGTWGAAFSPSGAYLLLGGHDQIDRLWDVAGQQVKTSFEKHPDSDSYAVTFDGEGRALTAGKDRILRALDVRGGKSLDRFALGSGQCFALAVSEDGKRLLSGSADGGVRLWNLLAGSEEAVLSKHLKPVRSVAFSPNGRFAMSGGEDNAVRLWGLPPVGEAIPVPPPKTIPSDRIGEVAQYAGHSGEVRRVAWSPDGRRILSAAWDGTGLRLFDVPGLEVLQELKGHQPGPNDVSFFSKGKKAISVGGDKTVRIWDIEAGSELKKLDGEMGMHAVAVSEDGRWAATCGGSETVLLWDLNEGRIARRLNGHQPAVGAVAFTPKGDFLLAGDGNGTIRVWRTRDGKEERRLVGPPGHVYNLRVTADGRHVFSCGPKAVRLWSLRSGREFRRFEGRDKEISGLSLSADGRRLLSSGENLIFHLWDVETGKEIRRFEGNASGVWDLAFSPDGRYAASAGADKTLRLWKMPPDPLVGKPRERPAPPGADAQAKAETVVKDRYKAEYAFRSPSERSALAKALRQKGVETTDDQALRYVYLREARDVAASAGDSSLSRDAIDEMSFLFEDDELAGRLAALKVGAKSANVTRVALAANALELLDDAVTADQYETADAALAIAKNAVLKTKDPQLARKVSLASTRVAYLLKEYTAVAKAGETLAGQPADKEASLAMGKFQCFRKEDWVKGLPLLVAGSDPELASLARRDLAAPSEAKEVAEVGLGWWEVSEKEPAGMSRNTIRRHGRALLYQALPRLTGLEVTKVADRLKVANGKGFVKPGLVAEYFADEVLKKKVKTALEYHVYLDWGAGSPGPEVPADHFSARWRGWLVAPPRKGKYTLYIHADDGARLFLDHKPVPIIDTWTIGGRHTAEVQMTDRPYHLRIEYREAIGNAAVIFGYVEGGKDRPIPMEWLFHDEPQEKFLAK